MTGAVARLEVGESGLVAAHRELGVSTRDCRVRDADLTVAIRADDVLAVGKRKLENALVVFDQQLQHD